MLGFRWRVYAWTVGLIAGVTLLVIAGPVIWQRSRLQHPVQVVAPWVTVTHHRHCLRTCWSSTDVAVVFADSQGRPHRAQLRGLAQDDAYYQPGITVVFNAAHPDQVMALRDFQDGRSALGWGLLLTGVLIVSVEVAVAWRWLHGPADGTRRAYRPAWRRTL